MSTNCEFEHEDLCGWSQTTEDEFDWIWHQGSTPTQYSGPLNDHTFNSSAGHYLFIESSSPQKFGHRARLLSPAYTEGTIDGMCLQFYYHMFGPDKTGEVGNLSVYIITHGTNASGNDTTERLFHIEGNQGDDWIVAEVYIPSKKTTVQLEFQATRLNGSFSDIAIDDVIIRNCTQGSELTLSTAMRPNTNAFREIATERTLPLHESVSSTEEWGVTSSETRGNDTFTDDEGMEAAVLPLNNQSHMRIVSSNKTQTNISTLSHTYPPTRVIANFLSHTTPSSDKTSTTINILYNDFANDNDNDISYNREGYTFETRHTIILNLIIVIFALAVAVFMAFSWLRQRRRRRLIQRQVGHTTVCLAAASSKKWTEACAQRSNSEKTLTWNYRGSGTVNVIYNPSLSESA